MPKRLTAIEFIKRAQKVHNNKYDYSLIEYKNSKTKVKIICPEHGVFEQTPNMHLKGNKCPSCAHNKQKTTTEFIKQAKKIHKDKYDYSLVDYKGAHKKIKIICPDHGIFEQVAKDHLKGSGCPICTGKIKLTTKEFISRARKIHGMRYDYSLVNYIDNKIKVKIICPEHGVFEQRASAHLRGHECPKCAPIKRKQTNLQKYGVEAPIQNNEIYKRIKETTRKKHDVEYPLQNAEINKKFKQTCLQKYGVDNPLKSKEIRKKIERTNLEKYGVLNYALTEDYLQKVKNTNYRRYGVPFAIQSQEVQEKIRQTNLKKYGYFSVLQAPEIKEKSKQTCLQNYGVENFMQSKEYKKRLPQILEKIQNTCLEKYNVKNPSQAPEIKEKSKRTCLQKYGTETFMQSEEYKKRLPQILEKMQTTCLKKYKAKTYQQAHLKNTHLLTKEYLIENFLDENGGIKLQEMMDFYNMKETACYYYMRNNGIRITYKAGGFNPNRPATLYYLLDQETGLYKIGVTNKTIEERFPNADGSKRNMIILEQTYYENGYEALEAEQEILEAFSYCRCTNESWPEAWGGRTEFFKEDILLKDNFRTGND